MADRQPSGDSPTRNTNVFHIPLLWRGVQREQPTALKPTPPLTFFAESTTNDLKATLGPAESFTGRGLL